MNSERRQPSSQLVTLHIIGLIIIRFLLKIPALRRVFICGVTGVAGGGTSGRIPFARCNVKRRIKGGGEEEGSDQH
jgi:hypothetical protein